MDQGAHSHHDQEEVENTVHALQDSSRLARPPGTRPAFSTDGDDKHWRGGV